MTASRRRILGALGALAAVPAAGCLGGDDEDGNPLTPVASLTADHADNHLHGLGYDHEDGRLYLASHYGLFVHRAGDLYRVGDSLADHMGFTMHPEDPDRLFRSGHPQDGGNLGVERSADGGVTWERLFEGVDDETVDFHSMTVSDADPDVLYGSFQGTLYASESGGEDWRIAAAEGLPPQGPSWGVPALAADPDDRETVLAAAEGGLYESTDGGESWDRLTDGRFATVAVRPDDASTLYASTASGLEESTDRGETWSTLLPASELGGQPVFGVAVDRGGSGLYAATFDDVVYASEDDGGTWDVLLGG